MKTGYLPADNLNKIHVFHPVQVSPQSELRTLISGTKEKVRSRKINLEGKTYAQEIN
jgi:hypothetical protein